MNCSCPKTDCHVELSFKMKTINHVTMTHVKKVSSDIYIVAFSGDFKCHPPDFQTTVI